MGNKKILLVEDSKMVVNIIKIILEKEGIEVTHTDQGDQVLDMAKKINPDLVMLDLNMPKYPGEKVFEDLKSDPATKDIKVMILTAKTDAIKWEDNLKQCDSFVPKPFEKAKLVEEIYRLIN